MAEDTKIQWCDATFNPWEGCSRVSEGCRFCYAETRAKRFGTVQWGPQGTRRVASEAYWRQPLKWDREAKAAGERRRVFCASLADVFEDRPELIKPRKRLFEVIRRTPNLDWLLLTKRPENFKEMLPWPGWPDKNVWLGVSVENQAAADERIPLLLQTPAAVRFLSVEPLLESVDLSQWRPQGGIHLVIAGGESGPHARLCDITWLRSLRGQCQTAGVAFFLKQLGSRPCWSPAGGASGKWPDHVRFDYERAGEASQHSIRLRDSKGGDESEWASDLRGCRAFPDTKLIPTP